MTDRDDGDLQDRIAISAGLSGAEPQVVGIDSEKDHSKFDSLPKRSGADKHRAMVEDTTGYDRKLHREKRLAALSRIVSRGVEAPHELAEILGVSVRSVTRDLKLLKNRWQRDQKDFKIMHSRHIAGLNEVRRECYAAWQKSKRPQETTTTKVESGELGTKKSVQHQSKPESPGDPRFMSIILDTWKEEADVRGLKVNKLALTDPTGQEEYRSAVVQEAMKMIEQLASGRAEIDVVDGAHVLRLADEIEAEQNTIDVAPTGD